MTRPTRHALHFTVVTNRRRRVNTFTAAVNDSDLIESTGIVLESLEPETGAGLITKLLRKRAVIDS